MERPLGSHLFSQHSLSVRGCWPLRVRGGADCTQSSCACLLMRSSASTSCTTATLGVRLSMRALHRVGADSVTLQHEGLGSDSAGWGLALLRVSCTSVFLSGGAMDAGRDCPRLCRTSRPNSPHSTCQHCLPTPYSPPQTQADF